MNKKFKRILSLVTVFALLLTALGNIAVFAGDEGEGDSGASDPVTVGYTTYAWQTFDKPVANDDKKDQYNVSFDDTTYFKGVYRNGEGVTSRMDGTYLDAVKVSSEKTSATYSKMDIKLANSGISFTDALANNLYVETEFDLYFSGLPNDNGQVVFASSLKSNTDPAVTLINKQNGEFKIQQIKDAYGSNYAAAQSNQNLADVWKRFKFVMHAGSGENASGETVNGWILDGVYMDGRDTFGAAKYKRGAVLSQNNYTDFLLNYKLLLNSGFVAVDNVSVTAYTQAQLDANGGVSPVPDRMAYLKDILSYKTTVETYNTTSMNTAYKNALDGFYKEGLLQSDLDALKGAIDAVAANYKKYDQYKAKLEGTDGADTALSAAKTAIDSGDDTAVAQAFADLDALLLKLPQSVANYTFETAAATKSASIYTDRYTFDDTTFAKNIAYNGTFYYKGEKSGFKFSAINFDELPANSYVRTSFDIKYSANGYKELVLSLRDKDGNVINRFGIKKAGGIYSKASEKNKFSLDGLTPGDMHRVTFTFKVTDSDGTVSPKMTDMSVDGVNTLGNEHLLNPKTYGVDYDTSMTSYAQLYFAPSSKIDGDDSGYSEYWLDNLSVVTYQSADGKTNIGDKTEFIKGLGTISSLYYSDTTSSDIKTKIDENKTSILSVFNDPVASKTEVSNAVAKQNELISEVVKAEFEKTITDSVNFSNVTSDITGMVSTYTSTSNQATFDINWTSNEEAVISSDGKVSRPRIGRNVKLSYVASSDTTGVTFKGSFDASVTADGSAVTLPASGQFIAEKTATDGTNVEINGSEIPVTFTGEKMVSVVIDTFAGKYAVYTDGLYVSGSDIDTGSLSSVKIDGTDIAVIKYNNEDYYEVKGFKYKSGTSEFSKPIAGTKVSYVTLADKNIARAGAVVVVAAYTNDGNVLYNKTAKTIDKYDLDNLITLDVELELPENRSDISIKAYVFSSLDSLSPVAPLYTYKSKINSNSTVYIAGDSTACAYTKESFPQTGWGQKLSAYFTDGLKVDNRAKGGCTAKTFYERTDSCSFNGISKDILPGDYLIIQFGHNESKLGTEKTLTDEEYKTYIKKYIDMALEKEALPILATSITRRSDLTDNDSIERLRAVTRTLATEYGIPCIDMGTYTKKLCNELGKEKSKFLYMFLDIADPRYSEDDIKDSKFNENDTFIVDGNYEQWVDDTHLNVYGADIYAMYVAQMLKDVDSTLDAYIDGSNILSYKDVVKKINTDYASYLEML